MGFIDTMRSEGHAVESTCRVLREQGCQVAARTYRTPEMGAIVRLRQGCLMAYARTRSVPG